MKIAIVTGASSGLGREFVRQIARKEKPDAVWVIARRENRLRELAEQTKTPVLPIPLDLTDPDGIEALKKLLAEKKPDVRLLVNAAGFGKIGAYEEATRRDADDMVALNCRALVDVTLLALPYMSRGARILEIGSASAFQPLPTLGVYAATKAFVVSYGRALRWELFGRGIHVTSVCPYWIRDTEFIPVAKDSAGKGRVRHFPLASRASFIAARALFDSKLNLPVCTPDPVSFFMRLCSKFIPREIIIVLWEGVRRL